ncbi:thioredoxin family protein [Oerskovia sp. M15]
MTHREMDVDEHHDLVRTFGILRTPTVLVLDPSGREVARMSGGVSRAHAIEALNVAVGSVV